MSRKKLRTDDPVVRTKAECRAQARAGLFDKLPEFKAMCLSPGGYEPIHAQHCLSPYMPDAVAASLIVAAREAAKVWRHPLAPVKAEGADGEGGGGINVYIDPFACSAEYTRKWCEYLRKQGWTAPAGWEDPRPKEVPGQRTEVDRAALIAKLPKKEEPEDGGEGDAS